MASVSICMLFAVLPHLHLRPIYPSNHPSIYLYLSIHTSSTYIWVTYRSIHPSTHLFIHLSIYVSMHIPFTIVVSSMVCKCVTCPPVDVASPCSWCLQAGPGLFCSGGYHPESGHMCLGSARNRSKCPFAT